jgi:hypothetical protein
MPEHSMLRNILISLVSMFFAGGAVFAQDIPEPKFKLMVMVPKIMIFTTATNISLDGRALQEFLVFCKYIENRNAGDSEEVRKETRRDQENCKFASELGGQGGALRSSVLQTIQDFCHRLRNRQEYILCEG